MSETFEPIGYLVCNNPECSENNIVKPLYIEVPDEEVILCGKCQHSTTKT